MEELEAMKQEILEKEKEIERLEGEIAVNEVKKDIAVRKVIRNEQLEKNDDIMFVLKPLTSVSE